MKARNHRIWRTAGPIRKIFGTTLTTFMLMVPTTGLAASFAVGGVSLTIPNPAGFAPLTPQMKSAYELQQHLVPTTVKQFAAYIPESEVGKALDDAGDPNLNRTFSVQAAKALINSYLKPSDFRQVKNLIKTQNDEMIRKAEKEKPDRMKSANDYMNGEYGKTLDVLGVIALPVHEETDRSISYSVFEKLSVGDRAGGLRTYVATGTNTLLYVNGKVLSLSCYAEKDGLEWSRTALRRWANAIVAANSP